MWRHRSDRIAGDLRRLITSLSTCIFIYDMNTLNVVFCHWQQVLLNTIPTKIQGHKTHGRCECFSSSLISHAELRRRKAKANLCSRSVLILNFVLKRAASITPSYRVELRPSRLARTINPVISTTTNHGNLW